MAKILISSIHVQTDSVVHLCNDNGALPPGVKRTVHDADHSLPYSIEIVERLELYLHKKIKIHNGANIL
jgi:hypothetical protein